jgi:hypothetical protein
MAVTIDPSKLTLGDTIEFETLIGKSWQEVFAVKVIDGEQVSEVPMKALAVLIWIFERKENAELTYEDVLARPISDIGVDFGADAPDPTPAAG